MILLSFLLDTLLTVGPALIFLNVLTVPLWLSIVVSVILLITCGAKFNLLKLAVDLVIVLTILGVWNSPMWLRVIIVALQVVGLGILYFDKEKGIIK